MEDFKKLKTLLCHWMEHNDEHAEIYRDWAEKASTLGNEKLSEILNRISRETIKLKGLFEEALKLLD